MFSLSLSLSLSRHGVVGLYSHTWPLALSCKAVLTTTIMSPPPPPPHPEFNFKQATPLEVATPPLHLLLLIITTW